VAFTGRRLNHDRGAAKPTASAITCRLGRGRTPATCRSRNRDLILKGKVGAYVIDGANPRHEHEWQVWKNAKLGPGQVLIPGVISHATNVVEHPELVAERITRLARVIGRENVIAGTDCGFAQGPFYRRVHPSVMWAKLEALSEGARLASRELWS
jgi:5-methyltetrahydropteroyltriglutamate--homocysteine methyltransferase